MDPAYERIGSPEELASRIDCQAAKDGRTEQSHADECNINKIVARYDVAAIQRMALERGPGQYLDVSEIGDYRQAMTHIAEANAVFAQLPAEIRREFDNDPALFLDVMADPAYDGWMIELGLKPAVVEEAPAPPVVESAPAAPAVPAAPAAEGAPK